MRKAIPIALLVLATTVGRATPESEQPPMSFRLSLRSAAGDGQLGLLGPTAEMQYENSEAAPTAWYTWEFYAKEPERCATGLNAPVADTLGPGEPGAFAQWFVRFRLLERTPQGPVVQTELRRVLSGVSETGMLQRRRTLRLTAGTPVLLDSWFADEDPDARCALFVLEAEGRFVDPPAVSDAYLAYDVWLVHRGSDGQESQHLVTSARQGGKVEYAFAPLRFTTDGASSDSGPIRLSVSGNFIGRARADGGVDLLIGMIHGFGDEQSGSSSSGRKFVQVSQGETVEVQVPSLTGADGIRHLEPAFAAHRTALRIRVRRTF